MSLFKSDFPCPICCTALKVKYTKKNKPYVVCDPCGDQMFVRREEGIQRFDNICESYEKSGIPGMEQSEIHPSGTRFSLLARLRQLLAYKKTLEDEQGLFSKDPDLRLALRVVEEEVQSTRANLRAGLEA